MNPDIIIEFERREELAKAVVKETSQANLEIITELDTFESRQAFHSGEHEYLQNNFPNIYASVRTLGEAYGWQEFCAPNKKGFAQRHKEFKRAKSRQEKLKDYFILGGYYGSLAYRCESGAIGKKQADLPYPLEIGLASGSMAINHSNAATIFELLEKDTEDLTYYLSNALDESSISYPSPENQMKKSTILGAVASYHLCSFADWHSQGKKHEFNAQLDELIADSIWLEFESYKYSIQKMLSSMPSKIRDYKKLDVFLSGRITKMASAVN